METSPSPVDECLTNLKTICEDVYVAVRDRAEVFNPSEFDRVAKKKAVDCDTFFQNLIVLLCEKVSKVTRDQDGTTSDCIKKDAEADAQNLAIIQASARQQLSGWRDELENLRVRSE